MTVMTNASAALPVTTGVLTPGVPLSGHYAQAGDVNWFRFRAEAGQHYSFTAKDGPISYLGEYDVGIADAAGKIIASETREFSPATTGDYLVSTMGFSAGDYTIQLNQLADDYSADGSNSGSLSAGGRASGVINYTGDADRFQIQLEAGQVYTVHYTSDAHSDTSNPAAQLAIAAPDGSAQASATTYNSDGSANLVIMPTTNGQYSLTMSSNSQFSAGTAYTLSVSAGETDDFGGTIDSATALSLGGSVHGMIQAPQDVDTFRIDLQAGTTYALSLQGDPVKGLTTEFTLVDGSGHVVAIGPNEQGLRTFTPATSGSYYVNMATGTQASSFKGDEAYTLSLSLAPDDVGANAATAGSLAIGTPAHGELQAGGGDVDWYAISLDAGSTYWFQLLGANEGKGTLASAYYDHEMLRVVDASGHQLATTAGASAYGATAPTLAFVPTDGGVYYVEVSGSRSGTYQLQAQLGTVDDVGNDIAHAANLAAGGPTTGTLEIPSDHDVFHFNAASSDTYAFKLSGAAGQHNVTLLAYDSKGGAVAVQQGSTSDGSLLVQLDHLPAGDYYFDV